MLIYNIITVFFGFIFIYGCANTLKVPYFVAFILYLIVLVIQDYINNNL